MATEYMIKWRRVGEQTAVVSLLYTAHYARMRLAELKANPALVVLATAGPNDDPEWWVR